MFSQRKLSKWIWHASASGYIAGAMTNGEKLLGNIKAKDIDAEVQMCVVQKRF